eukprot:12464518-Heterocapsa_arctica.AAC.1
MHVLTSLLTSRMLMTWISLGLPSFRKLTWCGPGLVHCLACHELASCCTVRCFRHLGHAFPPAPAPARGVPGAGPTLSGVWTWLAAFV